MHMAWPIPGVGIDDPEALYCPIFSAHAYLLGKKNHLMIVPRFESDPIKLAEPAFRKVCCTGMILDTYSACSDIFGDTTAQVARRVADAGCSRTVDKSRQALASDSFDFNLGRGRSRLPNVDGSSRLQSMFHSCPALAAS